MRLKAALQLHLLVQEKSGRDLSWGSGLEIVIFYLKWQQKKKKEKMGEGNFAVVYCLLY